MKSQMISFILRLRGLKKTLEMLLSALTKMEHKEEQFLDVCHSISMYQYENYIYVKK